MNYSDEQYEIDMQDFENRRHALLACEKICLVDGCKRTVRDIMYDSRLDRKIAHAYNKLAISAEHLRSLYDKCILKFAPYQWELYHIREFLCFDMCRSTGDREYLLSELGDLYVEYKKALESHQKLVKSAKTRLITQALNGYQMPLIRYIEVYQKAEEKLSQTKVSDTKSNKLIYAMNNVSPRFLGSLFKD